MGPAALLMSQAMSFLGSLGPAERAQLEALPRTAAGLLRSIGPQGDAQRDALIAILESDASFESKALQFFTGGGASLLGGVSPSASPTVNLDEILDKAGACVECGAFQSVGALVGMSPGGVPLEHPFVERIPPDIH